MIWVFKESHILRSLCAKKEGTLRDYVGNKVKFHKEGSCYVLHVKQLHEEAFVFEGRYNNVDDLTNVVIQYLEVI